MIDAELLSDGTVSVKGAVSFLSISRTELWRLINAEKIQALRSGRRVLVPRKELVRFLGSLAVVAQTKPAARCAFTA